MEGTTALRNLKMETSLFEQPGRPHAWGCLFFPPGSRPLGQNQGCGIKGFIPTSVIQGNPFFFMGGQSLGGPCSLYPRSGFHFPQPHRLNQPVCRIQLVLPSSQQETTLLLLATSGFCSPRCSCGRRLSCEEHETSDVK